MRALATVLLLGATVGAVGAAQASQSEGTPDCIDHWGEARYRGYGYQHVVHVENQCDALAHCEVWTNVNEEKHSVDVAAGEHEEVVTYQSSPARDFKAHARCELED